jgi:hypothetical protein
MSQAVEIRVDENIREIGLLRLSATLFKVVMMRFVLTIAGMLVSVLLFPGLIQGQGGVVSNDGTVLIKPRVVYVADFVIDPSLVQTSPQATGREGGLLSRLRQRGGNADSSDPATEAAQAVNQLADSIVSSLVRAGVPAERIGAQTSVPADCWMLEGRFDKLSEGNRLQQSVIGFGAGEPEVEVSGTMDAMQGTETILTFGDQSRQSHMPGGAVSRNPYVIAAKFVLSRGATGRDVQKLGESVASEIVNYMRTKGLLK